MLLVAALWIAIGLYALMLAPWMQRQAVASLARIRSIPVLGPIYANRLMEWWVRSSLCLWNTRLVGALALLLGLWLGNAALHLAH